MGRTPRIPGHMHAAPGKLAKLPVSQRQHVRTVKGNRQIAAYYVTHETSPPHQDGKSDAMLLYYVTQPTGVARLSNPVQCDNPQLTTQPTHSVIPT